MNNAQKYGFREDLKIFEGHMHLECDLPVDETVEIFRKVKEYYGYECMNLLAVPNIPHRNMKATDISSNLKAIYCKSRIPKLYASAGLIHHFDERDTAEGFLKQAERAYAQGFDGFKCLEGKPMLRKAIGKRLDDPIYDLFYGFAEEKEMPIVMHVADPASFWDIASASEYAIRMGWICDETYPTKDELHEETEGILKKFPKLKLVLAHFNFMSDDLERCDDFLTKYPSVYFDLTPGASMFVNFNKRLDDWRDFFCRYRKRIAYGSDTYNFRMEEGSMHLPYTDRINYVRYFLETDREFTFNDNKLRGILLPDNVIEDIYYNNTYNRLGERRPINYAAVLEECEELLKSETDELTRLNVQTVKALCDWKL